MVKGARGTPGVTDEARKTPLKEDRQMSEIAQFETRISAALDRIRAAAEAASTDARVDAAPDTAQAPAAGEQADRVANQPRAPEAREAPDTAAAEETDVAELRRQLDEERTANAQLEERVKTLKHRQDGKLNDLESAVAAGRKRAAKMDRELQRLRQVNAELREINDQLRQAVEAGISEPHLVNKAMMAELDALRATRAADAAEMDAILGELRPILQQEA
jgi:chromosome segregation ATPase